MHRVVMIAGQANTGKSTSLRNLKDRAKYAYLNADDKPLPIGGAKAFLTNAKVGDPLLAPAMYGQLEQEPRCEGIILDTLTYLMANYERKIVNTSTNTMDGLVY